MYSKTFYQWNTSVTENEHSRVSDFSDPGVLGEGGGTNFPGDGILYLNDHPTKTFTSFIISISKLS